jgi:hypothetical protein
MQSLARIASAAVVASVVSGVALAEDYVPMTSTTSGRELARVYRPASDSVSKEQIIRDKSGANAEFW